MMEKILHASHNYDSSINFKIELDVGRHENTINV